MNAKRWLCSPFTPVHAPRPLPLRRPSLRARLRRLWLLLALRHADALLADATQRAYAHDWAAQECERDGDPEGADRHVKAADRADREVGRWGKSQGELERELHG